jgi:hypothetical protein
LSQPINTHRLSNNTKKDSLKKAAPHQRAGIIFYGLLPVFPSELATPPNMQTGGDINRVDPTARNMHAMLNDQTEHRKKVYTGQQK